MSLKRALRPVWKAGYTEKDAVLPDGTVLHYAEGPANGKPPLLLIHGQTGAWQSYAAVLPALSRDYHVFAVDCHGHGKSSRTPGRYTAKAIGQDFVWFLKHVAGTPAVVSGHSSGGLLAAWLAANAPGDVSGAVLEDPPFFSTEQGTRWESSFAYVDTYAPMHAFLNQEDEKDWTVYYLKHAAWGRFVPEKTMRKMIDYGVKYRKTHPGKPLRYWFLPDSINRMFRFFDQYDLRFGDAFYDGSWFMDYQQSDVLHRIACPTVLIHTKWSYSDDGILMAAMSGEDAKRASALLQKSRLIYIDSGHEAHNEKPGEFLNAFEKLKSL